MLKKNRLYLIDYFKKLEVIIFLNISNTNIIENCP